MQLPAASSAGVLIAALCLCAQGQSTPGKEVKGLPPRATPADYQAHAQAGTVTVAAEFSGHSVPTLQGTLSTEDYVVIETGLFGTQGLRIKLSSDDFFAAHQREEGLAQSAFRVGGQIPQGSGMGAPCSGRIEVKNQLRRRR